MPTVRTNGIETYYERRGEGPAVVFVHASMLDHSMWDEQTEALSDDYTTVTYDLRGHGRTGGTADPAYSMAQYADDLNALLDALDLDRPVVCGWSFGGTVALTHAAAHPDRISGLVLAESWTPEILSGVDWLFRRVVLNVLVPPVRLLGLERVERANVWLTERVFRGSSGEYENVERLREAAPKMSTDEFAKVARLMTRFHETTVDLSAVSVPTFVLYGENGLPYVRTHAAKLAATLPDVEVDEVPGAGHAANLDAPDYFTDALRAFLASVHGERVGAGVESDGGAGTD